MLALRTTHALPQVLTRTYSNTNLSLDSHFPVFSAAGAVADIFDISCLLKKPSLVTLSDSVMAAWTKAPANAAPSTALNGATGFRRPDLLGKHYFTTNAAGGISPRWDFTARFGPDAFVVAAKAGGIPAPTGAQDVDWLSLTSVSGALATEVYRTDTRLGQPPKSVRHLIS